MKKGPPPAALRLHETAFAALPGWDKGAQDGARAAFARSCARITTLPAGRAVGPRGIAGAARDWRAPCAALPPAGAGAAALRRYFETWFRPFAVTDSAGAATGTITGYYEAQLNGARRRTARYHVPIFARPRDLVTVDLGRFDPALKGRRIEGRVAGSRLVPYPDRAAIEDGALDGRAPVLVWVDSPVDAFFLHVQGSGLVKLAGGGTMQIGYAGTNGRPFTAIGRTLIARGAVPADGMSMQAIRAWIAANPARGRALMRQNARYVFFRKLDGAGPVGAEGVALTPGRSLAVDTRLLPLGAPVWLATRDPLSPATPLRRLMVAQDAGSAIRGAVRADFFWGAGTEAARRAGGMKASGRYWLLLPRTVAPLSVMAKAG